MVPEINPGRPPLGTLIDSQCDSWENTSDGSFPQHWPELWGTLVPVTLMSEGACLRRHAEKKAVEEKAWPEKVEEDEVNPWVKYTQFINKICTSYCQDVVNFNPIFLQQQLKALADNFPYKHTPMPVPEEFPQPEMSWPEYLGRENLDSSAEVSSKKKVHHDAMNRIMLQWYHDGAIHDGMSTNISDQGIRFNKEGNPWDKNDPSSHDEHHKNKSSEKPVRSPAGYRGAPGGDEPRDESSSDESSSYKSSHGGGSSKSSLSPDEGSSLPTSPGIQWRIGKLCSPQDKTGSKTSKSYRETAYKQSHTRGTDVYRDKGLHKQSKYVKAMHDKFHWQIDSKVSVLCESPNMGGKHGPWVPNPLKYGGKQDTKEFECWLNGLLRWLKVNKICGLENNSDCIEFTAMFLENNMLSWFEDNVNRVYHQWSVCNFKDMITRLYNWFAHDNLTYDVSDKFWQVKYNAEEGIMSYYYKLEWYANRMIEAPDVFTFRSQLVIRLPVNMVTFILDKGCTIETASMDEILFFAKEAEDIERMTRCFKETKPAMDLTKLKSSHSLIKTSKEKDQYPDRSPEQSWNHHYGHDRSGYHDNERNCYLKPPEWEPQNHSDKDHHDTSYQPSGGHSSRSNENKSDKKSNESKKPICYICSGPHYSTDKKCPKYGHLKTSVKMYAVREGTAMTADQKPCDDMGQAGQQKEENPDTDLPVKERLAMACSDSEVNPVSEYGSVQSNTNPYGSQYSSEGELYNLESDSASGKYGKFLPGLVCLFHG
jgi:hypothetical protein